MTGCDGKFVFWSQVARQRLGKTASAQMTVEKLPKTVFWWFDGCLRVAKDGDLARELRAHNLLQRTV